MGAGEFLVVGAPEGQQVCEGLAVFALCGWGLSSPPRMAGAGQPAHCH